MENNISAPIKIAVTVLLLAIIVMVVLKVVGSGNDLQQKGMSSLNSGLSSLSKQELAAYDNKSGVSGSEVLSVLDLYKDSDYGILVSTKAGGKDKAFNYGALLTTKSTASDKQDATGAVKAPEIKVSEQAVGDDGKADDGTIKRRKDTPSYLGLQAVKDGELIRNSNVGATKNPNNEQCVNQSGKFQSYLVYNAQSMPIAIYFKQTQ